MMLKKRILALNLGLTFYDIVPVPEQYLALCTCVQEENDFNLGIGLFTVPLEGTLALYSPTHYLP
jgi:hypothetical protein